MVVREPHNTMSPDGMRQVRQRFGHPTREGGQSLVELALVIPLLLLLLVGIIEIGRFAYYSILVSNVARAGAQYGAQSLAAAADTVGITQAARNDGQGIPAGTLNITPVQQCGCSATTLGSCGAPAVCIKPQHALVYVQVTAAGSFQSLFKYPGLPATLNVTSVEEMRVAQ
jgi:Flp pilus assembly protein TadG